MTTPHHRHPKLASGSISSRNRSYRVQPKTHRQIRPRQILGLNQIDFPLPMPILQLLLALDRRRHVFEKLEADEAINGISRRKPPAFHLPMLNHPRQQVRRNADIQRPVMLACKDINAGLFAHRTYTNNKCRHPELVSGSISRPTTIRCVRGWMLKQVQHDGAWRAACDLRMSMVR